jgi:hypothetical protein
VRELANSLGLKIEDEEGVGGSYYCWTRLTLPLLLGRFPNYGEHGLRSAFPLLEGDAYDKFAVHRLYTIKGALA